MPAGQPKPTFYVALALVVLGLIGFAIYRSDIVAPKPVPPQGGGEGQPEGKPIEPKDLGAGKLAESTDSTTSHDRQGVQLQAGREAAAGEGNGRLQAAARTTPSGSR